MTIQKLAAHFNQFPLVIHGKKLHQKFEVAALKKLTRNQLNLVYSILFGVPLGILLNQLHPIVSFATIMGICAVDQIRKDFMSKQMMRTFNMAFGVDSYLFAGRIGLTALKTNTVVPLILMGTSLLFGTLSFLQVKASFNNE